MVAVTVWNATISHIFGGANRKNSEKYGLVVYLCGERCHRTGRYAAHNNAETMAYLRRKGQEMAEKQMSRDEFIKIFGRNYL
jgi:methionine aminopeptidase